MSFCMQIFGHAPDNLKVYKEHENIYLEIFSGLNDQQYK